MSQHDVDDRLRHGLVQCLGLRKSAVVMLRGGTHWCRGLGDHRPILRDGRALRPGRQPETARRCSNPHVGNALYDASLTRGRRV